MQAVLFGIRLRKLLEIDIRKGKRQVMFLKVMLRCIQSNISKLYFVKMLYMYQWHVNGNGNILEVPRYKGNIDIVRTYHLSVPRAYFA